MARTEINPKKCLDELRNFLEDFPCIEMECADAIRILIADVANLCISYIERYGFISLSDSMCVGASSIHTEISCLKLVKSYLTIGDSNIVQQLLDIVDC